MEIQSKNDFIKQTQVFWGEQYGEPLTELDAQEILNNVHNFFSVLRECRERKKAREGGDALD